MKAFHLALLATAVLSAPSLAQEDWRREAAAALPETGELHLQLLYEDEADGFMRLGWQRDDEGGVLRYYDRTMWASPEIYETMGASVDLETLAPIDVAIRFHQQSAILSVEAVAQDGVMTGGRSIIQPFVGEQAAPINVPVTEGMVMREAVFLLAQTLPLEAGDSISFDWFASMAGTAASVTITAVDGGRIDTLSGRHDTIRLELRGSVPENDIYVTDTDGVRQVVRIDVLGQPMRFEALPVPAED
ncbi:hypothetical protein V0U79_11100 [Hyphobacterium sp. HN65]|uniref:DUF3108 domain-containing protein n=1 Tax=Hyphobacterium lacteum TaxID=3116575 RepID=A0ABU7LUA8_9PROT|nr:hypothetical protein [Hyphobacterium sp. HN65]MEE2526919.1 hypothetical protein [Hyphobacterium sp. HN65]